MNELKILQHQWLDPNYDPVHDYHLTGKPFYRLQYGNWIIEIADTSSYSSGSRVQVFAKNNETEQELFADLGTHPEISGKEYSNFTSEQADLLAAIRDELGYCIPTIEELYDDWWDEKYQEYHEPIFSDGEELRKVMESGKSVILHGCEFWLVTAICSMFPEDGRRNAILIRYLREEYSDGYVIFDDDGIWSPVTEENVEALLEEEWGDGTDQTLNSVRLRDS